MLHCLLHTEVTGKTVICLTKAGNYDKSIPHNLSRSFVANIVHHQVCCTVLSYFHKCTKSQIILVKIFRTANFVHNFFCLYVWNCFSVVANIRYAFCVGSAVHLIRVRIRCLRMLTVSPVIWVPVFYALSFPLTHIHNAFPVLFFSHTFREDRTSAPTLTIMDIKHSLSHLH